MFTELARDAYLSWLVTFDGLGMNVLQEVDMAWVEWIVSHYFLKNLARLYLLLTYLGAQNTIH